MGISRVLIVEDEELLSEKIAKRLNKEGIHTLVCNNGAEAVEVLEKGEAFDLVLSDVNMPRMNGLDLLKWIQANKKSLRVILLTANTEDNDVRDAVNFGAYGFLSKPVVRDELIKAVKNALPTSSGEDKISHREFIHIPIDEFLVGSKVDFPIYIYLKGGRFLKVAHEGSVIDMSRVQGLKSEHDVYELWIQKEDLLKYFEICKKFIAILRGDPTKISSFPQRIHLLAHICEMTFENILCNGVNKDNIEFAYTLLSLLIAKAKEYTNPNDLFSVFRKKRQRLTSSSIFSAMIMGLIVDVMGWSSEKNRSTLILGALLRDVGWTRLPDELREKKWDEMTDAEKEEFKKHPELSSELLKPLSTLPDALIPVILEHHMTGTSTGYPAGVSQFSIAKMIASTDVFMDEFWSGASSEFGKPLSTMVENRKSEVGQSDKSLKEFLDAFKLLVTQESFGLCKEQYRRLTL